MHAIQTKSYLIQCPEIQPMCRHLTRLHNALPALYYPSNPNGLVSSWWLDMTYPSSSVRRQESSLICSIPFHRRTTALLHGENGWKARSNHTKNWPSSARSAAASRSDVDLQKKAIRAVSLEMVMDSKRYVHNTPNSH